MVKADARKNYYADLELSTNADQEEVKRQFRLLAKLYHPDRNRGHEVEFVDKFQAIQAAHEILSDPAEKAKYDAARTKLQARQSAPVPPSDPYGFERRPAGPTRTRTTAAPGGPQSNPRTRPAFNAQSRESAASAGAEKVAAFARAQPQGQTWTRERYEEAARAEAARGFSTMRSAAPPPQPPRPPRPHPTAARPPSTVPAPDQQYAQNGIFPGMAKTASQRRQYPEEPQQRTAYQYVQAGRTPTGQSHGAEAFPPQSPQQARSGASPLRHTRSTEQSIRPERPEIYTGGDGRYTSKLGAKFDVHSTGLGRSASVRNSPVDPAYDDNGPFGRSRTHGGATQRHHSASPKLRATSFSSSDSSDDDRTFGKQNRASATPRSPQARARPNDGLEQQASNSNYTRVVDESNSFIYPPPSPKQPTRQPFPNMTSPDEPHAPGDSSFSRVASNSPKHGDAFRAANFSHQDWAERLKSTSPVKWGPKAKQTSASRSDASPDAMDVDSSGPTSHERVQRNGINLNDLKEQAPFKSEGLDGVDDLKQSLPFESRASTHIRTDSRARISRLKTSDYPQPPRPISSPALDRLNDENWKQYIRSMKEYVAQWNLFELNMIEHFKQRRIRLNTCMSENWMSMPSDGPPASQIDAMNGVACATPGMRAGYGAYMDWLKDDEMCHAWWDRAGEMHKQVMEELGQVREKLMGSKVVI